MNRLSWRLTGVSCLLLAGVCAQAADSGLGVRFTKEVSAAITVLKVVSTANVAGTTRGVTFTLQALVPCKRLSVFGHAYSADNVKLGDISIGNTLLDVMPGEKYQTQQIIPGADKEYLLLDKVICIN